MESCHKHTRVKDAVNRGVRKQLDSKRKKLSKSMREVNQTRLDTLTDMTRGLIMPDRSKQAALNSFYKARVQFVKKAIALNYTDYEVIQTLGITGKTLSDIKAKIFKEEITTATRMTQMEHFVEYRLKQLEVVKDLDVLIECFRDKDKLSSLASALRAKQDTLKEIKSAAQEVGLFEKKPEEVHIVAGVNVQSIETAELIDKIHKGNVRLNMILNNYYKKKPARTEERQVIEAAPEKRVLKIKRTPQP